MSSSFKKQRQTQRSGESNVPTLYHRIDAFHKANPHRMLFITLGIAALMAGFLFDIKLHTGGDDSAYVLQANDFARNGAVPVGFKSPGYPMMLAIFVLFGGLNIVLLKFTSIALYLGMVASFYFIFQNKLDPVVLDVTMLLMAVNAVMLDYSHHVYSEMLYTFVQLWGIYFFWKAEEAQWTVKSVFLVALVCMLGFYSRALGGTLPLAVALWLLIRKNRKALLWFGGFSVLLYLPLKVAEFAYGVMIVGQAPQILMVNPYNPSLGTESISGLITRTFYNIAAYLKYLFPKSLGLPSWEHLSLADGSILPDGKAFVSVLFSLVVILGLVQLLRKKSTPLPFVGFYTVVYVLFLCFSLQNLFTSVRFLVPVVPFLIMAFFSGTEVLVHRVLRTQSNKTVGFKRLFVLVAFAAVISNATIAAKAVDENIPILRANLRGEEFVGYPVDWVNYLKACRWIGANLRKDSVGVICRKPELFQVYTGGYLAHGVYQVESTDPDTIVANWKGWKMTHLLYDNFQWTGTLRRYVQPVAEKYPALFALLHQEGTEAPSFVYRLNYEAISSK